MARVAAEPITAGYADPPYLGCCGYYDHHHPDGRCWDDLATHRRLLVRLENDYPQGWALSCSARSLPLLLPAAPAGTQVAAWIRGARAHATARVPLSSWEPVLYRGGRLLDPSGDHPRRVDSLVHGVSVRTTDPGRLIGAKPAAFWWWLFPLLGLLPGDTFVDLFSGSGRGADAWARYASLADELDASPPGGFDTSHLQGADVSASTSIDG